MRKINEILDEIKKQQDLNNDTELAAILGVKPNTVSTWRSRGTIPYNKIYRFCEHYKVNMDELLTGGESMTVVNESMGEYNIADEYTGKILELLNDMDEYQRRSILYYIEKEKLLSDLIKKKAGEEWDGVERRKKQRPFNGSDRRKVSYIYKV